MKKKKIIDEILRLQKKNLWKRKELEEFTVNVLNEILIDEQLENYERGGV